MSSAGGTGDLVTLCVCSLHGPLQENETILTVLALSVGWTQYSDHVQAAALTFTCVYGRGGLRAVTHYDVSTEQCKKALEVMLAILAEPDRHALLPGKWAMGNGTPLVGPEAQTVNGY